LEPRLRLLVRLLAAMGGLVLGLLLWAGAALAHGSQAAQQLEYTVAPGDTLWGLAQRFYGDGARYSQIVAANAGRQMPDGRRLTNASSIDIGWKLLIPSSESSGGAAERPAEYTVAPGDTLAGIAAKVLGDDTRWPDLFNANSGATTDGKILTNPNLIWPGLRLTVPRSPAAPARTAPATVAAGSTCPTEWTCADIGSPAEPGSQRVNDDPLGDGTLTLSGAGVESVAMPTDQLHYVWRTLPGDGGISARISQPHALGGGPSLASAKAGLMLRGSPQPGAPYFEAAVQGGGSVRVEYRAVQDRPGAFILLPQPVSFPNPAAAAAANGAVYLRVRRVGSSFSAYSSPDGAAWSLIPGSATDIPSLAGPVLAGLSVSSLSSSALSEATFQRLVFSSGGGT